MPGVRLVALNHPERVPTYFEIPDPDMTKGNCSHLVVELSNLFSGASHKDLLINPGTESWTVQKPWFLMIHPVNDPTNVLVSTLVS